MSMIGSLKQISPRMLAAMESDPSLAQAVIDFGATSFETTKGSFPIPSNIKSIIDQMSADEQERFYSSLRQTWEGMMSDPRVAQVAESGRETAARGGQTLQSAGFTEADVAPEISIEKAWHGLHFLQCGETEATSSPLGSLILGGTEVGEDIGYGPARCLTPEEVRMLAAALDRVTDEELTSRYDADSMNELGIYPGGWEDEQNIEWLLEAARQVRQYYNEAAGRGFAMLLYLT